jgi:hypothetical protein
MSKASWLWSEEQDDELRSLVKVHSKLPLSSYPSSLTPCYIPLLPPLSSLPTPPPLLLHLQNYDGAKNWKKIAVLHSAQRSEAQCQNRWLYLSKAPRPPSRPHTPEDDELLKAMVVEDQNERGADEVQWSKIDESLGRNSGYSRFR